MYPVLWCDDLLCCLGFPGAAASRNKQQLLPVKEHIKRTCRLSFVLATLSGESPLYWQAPPDKMNAKLAHLNTRIPTPQLKKTHTHTHTHEPS